MKNKKQGISKSTKWIILIFCTVLVFNFIVTQVTSPKERELANITVKKYVDEMSKNDTEYYVYVGRPTCPHCVKITPILKQISYALKKNIYYINIDKENATSLSLLAEKTGNVYDGSTPLLMVVKRGTVLRHKSGEDNYKNIKDFFTGDDQ